MFVDFRSQYDGHSRVYLDPGDPVKHVYEGRYDAQGRFDLEEVGQEDFYAYIQSHRDSVEIHALLQRFNAGDESAFSRRQGFFADVSEMPKTYAEVLQSVLVGEQTFNRLPVEVKRKFNNSFSEWLASFGTEAFTASLGFQVPSAEASAPASAPAPAGSVAPADSNPSS